VRASSHLGIASPESEHSSSYFPIIFLIINELHNMLKITSASDAPRYRPYTVTNELRKLSAPIRINGEQIVRYKAPCITEYLDMESGEIIAAAALKDNPDVWPTVRSSERMLQREFILGSLREEVRKFAVFILQFRNQRRGVTPGIDQLVKWYATLTGTEAFHVRRYVKPLEDARIIAGSSVLGPLFQIAGRSVGASKHLGEDAEAARKFMLALMKQHAASRPEVIREAAPSYAAIVQAVRQTKLIAGEYMEALVCALSSAGSLRQQFPLPMRP
jgi:hypothetical protein